MSIKVMSYVWEGFPGSGSELLVMLAMADWCNDAGGSLYPSMRMVAEKIRVSEKQARRIVQSLEQDGYLAVVGNAHGGAPGTTKQFRVNVEKLKSLAAAREQTPPASVTPPMDVTRPMEGRGTAPTCVPDGSHPGVQTPPTHGSQTTIEPSINQEEKKARERAAPQPVLDRPDDVELQTWTDWLQLRKGKRAAVTKTVLAEARRQAELAGLTLDRFLAVWCARGSQGLEADWLKPSERGGQAQATGETPYQRQMRERVAEFAPSIARRAPGERSPLPFVEEIRDVPAIPSR